jgi:hypothetical protein
MPIFCLGEIANIKSGDSDGFNDPLGKLGKFSRKRLMITDSPRFLSFTFYNLSQKMSSPYTGSRDTFLQICELLRLLYPNGETINT